ncbi:hypothetical protein BBP40_002374 [Aspergillus hancockii]|nr:hypothetical protein BBP40_002374 [Aspergillus hancockii]
MTEAATPLTIFGVNVAVAYDWNVVDIYKWMIDVAADPEKYNPQPGKPAGITVEEKKKNLNQMLRQIMGLGIKVQKEKERFGDAYVKLTSSHYIYPAQKKVGTDQHIYRQLNTTDAPPPPDWPPDWDEIKRGRSEITVNQAVDYRYKHIHACCDEPNVTENFYWSPYDLLGLFLSSIGPPPPAASKDRFFLPLTALYGRWCSKIASGQADFEKQRGIDQLPTMFQCTWRVVGQQAVTFFLGAVSKGYTASKEQKAIWSRLMEYTRFQLLPLGNQEFDRCPHRWRMAKQKVCGKQPDGEDIPDSKLTAEQLAAVAEKEVSNNVSGQRYGNCAETYPYLGLLAYVYVPVCEFLQSPLIQQHRSGHATSSSSASGFALNSAFVRECNITNPDDLTGWIEKLQKYYEDPCSNCDKLIGDVANVSNFKKATVTVT